MADEALVHSALGGNEEAFRELVTRHKGRVFALAARFASDPAQQDDLAQEVFIRAWQRLGQYRQEAPFEHWLSRIAVHACYDFLRKERRSRFFLGRPVPLEEVPLRASDTLSAREASEVLSAALARLKPKERLIITLLELEERPIREIAALTGWSESSVKVRAFRAREALKKILSP